MNNKHPELFDSEWAIMQVVWEIEPCTAPTVQEKLLVERGWAYTTVKTMMDRLVKKRFLTTEKIRKLYLYRSAITRKQAQRGEVLKTMKRAFNGAMTPMMQFMIESENLSESDYQNLEKVLTNRKQ